MRDVEYEGLKKFMGLFYELCMANPSHRPESHPLLVLERLEKQSRLQAKRGLEMAINDCVEYSNEWSPDIVAMADKLFVLNGAPSLTEVRAKYSRRYLQVLKRGSIQSLIEYYLLKGMVDGGGIEPDAEEAEKLAAMLTEYEMRPQRKSE